MKRLLIGLFCMLLSCVVLAAGSDTVRKRSESGMLLTGTIEVAPDGSVSDYSIDHAEQVPPAVIEVVARRVPTWKFQPPASGTEGVVIKAKMSLRIVATWSDDKNYSINIAGASFSRDSEAADETVSIKQGGALVYPYMARRMGVSGTVYLLLRVDRQGRVTDATAEQVNLDFAASESEMEKWQGELAYAAVDTAKQWTFNTPRSGKAVDDKYWLVQVPAVFQLRREAYGRWKSYVPGPRQPVPWLEKSKLISGNVDAISAEGIHSEDQDLHLNTPLGGV